MTEKLLPLTALQEMIGHRSKSAIYADIKNGDFPKPIKIGSRQVRWRLSEILAWLEEKTKERDAA